MSTVSSETPRGFNVILKKDTYLPQGSNFGTQVCTLPLATKLQMPPSCTAVAASLSLALLACGVVEGRGSTAADWYVSTISRAFAAAQGITMVGTVDVYIADTTAQLIKKTNNRGSSTTVIAGSTQGNVQAQGTAAKFDRPGMITYSPLMKRWYVSQRDTHLIRWFDANYNVGSLIGTYTIAGNGANLLNGPTGVVVPWNQPGMLYWAETFSCIIRSMDITSASSATRVSGTYGLCGYLDGLDKTTSLFKGPQQIAGMLNGDLLVADTLNYRLRQVRVSDGMTQTYAGIGLSLYLDGPRTLAGCHYPYGLAVSPKVGMVVFTEYQKHTIRKIVADVVTTIVGTSGTAGDKNGPGLNALVNSPWQVGYSWSDWTFYVSQSTARTIRVTQFTLSETLTLTVSTSLSSSLPLTTSLSEEQTMSFSASEEISATKSYGTFTLSPTMTYSLTGTLWISLTSSMSQTASMSLTASLSLSQTATQIPTMSPSEELTLTRTLTLSSTLSATLMSTDTVSESEEPSVTRTESKLSGSGTLSASSSQSETFSLSSSLTQSASLGATSTQTTSISATPESSSSPTLSFSSPVSTSTSNSRSKNTASASGTLTEESSASRTISFTSPVTASVSITSTLPTTTTATPSATSELSDTLSLVTLEGSPTLTRSMSHLSRSGTQSLQVSTSAGFSLSFTPTTTGTLDTRSNSGSESLTRGSSTISISRSRSGAFDSMTATYLSSQSATFGTRSTSATAVRQRTMTLRLSASIISPSLSLSESDSEDISAALTSSSSLTPTAMQEPSHQSYSHTLSLPRTHSITKYGTTPPDTWTLLLTTTSLSSSVGTFSQTPTRPISSSATVFVSLTPTRSSTHSATANNRFPLRNSSRTTTFLSASMSSSYSQEDPTYSQSETYLEHLQTISFRAELGAAVAIARAIREADDALKRRTWLIFIYCSCAVFFILLILVAFLVVRRRVKNRTKLSKPLQEVGDTFVVQVAGSAHAERESEESQCQEEVEGGVTPRVDGQGGEGGGASDSITSPNETSGGSGSADGVLPITHPWSTSTDEVMATQQPTTVVDALQAISLNEDLSLNLELDLEEDVVVFFSPKAPRTKPLSSTAQHSKESNGPADELQPKFCVEPTTATTKALRSAKTDDPYFIPESSFLQTSASSQLIVVGGSGTVGHRSLREEEQVDNHYNNAFPLELEGPMALALEFELSEEEAAELSEAASRAGPVPLPPSPSSSAGNRSHTHNDDRDDSRKELKGRKEQKAEMSNLTRRPDPVNFSHSRELEAVRQEDVSCNTIVEANDVNEGEDHGSDDGWLEEPDRSLNLVLAPYVPLGSPSTFPPEEQQWRAQADERDDDLIAKLDQLTASTAVPPTSPSTSKHGKRHSTRKRTSLIRGPGRKSLTFSVARALAIAAVTGKRAELEASEEVKGLSASNVRRTRKVRDSMVYDNETNTTHSSPPPPEASTDNTSGVPSPFTVDDRPTDGNSRKSPRPQSRPVVKRPRKLQGSRRKSELAVKAPQALQESVKEDRLKELRPKPLAQVTSSTQLPPPRQQLQTYQNQRSTPALHDELSFNSSESAGSFLGISASEMISEQASPTRKELRLAQVLCAKPPPA